MKDFLKIIIYLVILSINFVFIQTDLLSQNDSLEKKDSLFIGGLYKLTFMNGEESFNEIQSYDSTSIKIMSKGSLIRLKRSNIKSVEKYTYILSLGMRKKDKESSQPEVTLTTKDLNIFHGKLLSITPVKYDELNKQDNTGQQKKVLEIERDKILSVLIHSESNVNSVLSGMGYGVLIGAGIGALLGYASGDDKTGFFRFKSEKKALFAGIGLGLLGGVVGLIVGISNSTPDEIIEIDSDDDFYRLNKYTESSFGEPPIYREKKSNN